MRIWIVNHYASPPGGRGGPTRHLGLARALRDRGHEVVIHASVYDHYSRTDHRPRQGRSTIESIEGITYVWWSTPPYRSMSARIRNMVAFAFVVSRHGHRLGLPEPDVVIGSSPHLLAGLGARHLARRAKVPFVFEVRDLWPQTFVDMGELGPRHPATLVLRRIESMLYRTADHVVTALPHAAPYIEARGAPAGRVTCIPNGVAIGPDPVDAPPDAGPFVVMYAGTLGHANGLEVTVDAAVELERRGRSDIRFRIVGAGPERTRLTELAAASAAISIEEPVPAGEVPALLSEADVCLLCLRPSPVFQWGVSPTKLFDYLAAARPVIAAVDAPDDILGPADAGVWIPSGDPVALADAIERVVDLAPDVRAAMGRRGRGYVVAHHDFAAAVRYEVLIRGLLAAPEVVR